MMSSQRRLNQRVRTALSLYTPATGLRYVVELDWDPRGPMTWREAAVESLERTLAALRGQAASSQAPQDVQGWEDVPLPGLELVSRRSAR